MNLLNNASLVLGFVPFVSILFAVKAELSLFTFLKRLVSEFVFLVLDLFVSVHHISLSLRCALTEDNDLILSLGVLPASEDEQVRSNGCTSMAEPRVGRLAHVLSTSPGHAVSRPDHEIITFIRGGVGLMLVTGSRSLGPSAKH